MKTSTVKRWWSVSNTLFKNRLTTLPTQRTNPRGTTLLGCHATEGVATKRFLSAKCAVCKRGHG